MNIRLDDAVPVTVLTGFLGAGKTTLLNRLLREPELADSAVLVNEFGEVGLDHLLLERLDGDTVLLNAGCLCCTVRGDLVDALCRLADRMEAGQPIARVLVETTGLADPAPILHTLMQHGGAIGRFRLGSVVTVVDALHGSATLDSQPEAVKQAAVADRVVLTKTDLADPAATVLLVRRLRGLNPAAPILPAAEAGPGCIFGTGPFTMAAKMPDVTRWLGEEANAVHHHHGHGHDPNRHDSRIHAFTLTYDRPLHWDGIGTFMDMLLRTRGQDVLRVKGILNLQGQERPLVIHAVQHMLHQPVTLDAWPPGDDRHSRLVFIVRDLTRDTVEKGLAAFEQAAVV